MTEPSKPASARELRPFSGYHNRPAPNDDSFITQVGPGTPGGEYLRRYWHPFLLASELKDLPVPVRLLGEDLVVFRETDLHIISQQDVIWRFVAAFIYAALALTMIAALSLLLSVFAENALGPIVATVCIVIVFTILQQLKVPVFEQTINPWSFTTHMLGWKGFFYVEKTSEGVTINGSIENPMALVRSGAILIGYTLLFVFIAERVYRKKDILC